MAVGVATFPSCCFTNKTKLNIFGSRAGRQDLAVRPGTLQHIPARTRSLLSLSRLAAASCCPSWTLVSAPGSEALAALCRGIQPPLNWKHIAASAPLTCHLTQELQAKNCLWMQGKSGTGVFFKLCHGSNSSVFFCTRLKNVKNNWS